MILLSCEENYKNDGENRDDYAYIDDHANTNCNNLEMLDCCIECADHIHECSVGGAGVGNINDIRFLIII